MKSKYQELIYYFQLRRWHCTRREMDQRVCLSKCEVLPRKWM